MLTAMLFFAAGIALLWVGTDAVLRRIPKIAAWLRVSPLVVTVLLVAVMTSLPELSVSIFASLRGQPSAAMATLSAPISSRSRSWPACAPCGAPSSSAPASASASPAG
jgi:Ca2+/Na+ antiporter